MCISMSSKIATLGCVFGAAVAAHAGDRIETRHMVFGIDKSQVIQIGAGDKLLSISTSEIVIADKLADDNPVQNLSGTCGGSVEIRETASKGGGVCVYTNPKGGKWVLTWDAPALSSATSGTYRLVGTEGNSSGWKGGGTWQQGPDFSESRYVQRWVGWVEKP